MTGIHKHIDYRNAAMDEALAERPPVIEWRLDPVRRIHVAAYVFDPHLDSGHNGTKASCKRGHPFTDENTIMTRDGRQCRTCKNANRKPLTPEQKQRAVELKRQGRRRLREERDVA